MTKPNQGLNLLDKHVQYLNPNLNDFMNYHLKIENPRWHHLTPEKRSGLPITNPNQSLNYVYEHNHI